MCFKLLYLWYYYALFVKNQNSNGVKLRDLFIVTVALMCGGCTKDEPEESLPKTNKLHEEVEQYHYWAGDEKVFLEAQPEKSFILFRSSDRYSLVDSRKMDYSVFKTSRLSENYMFRKGLTRAFEADNISWAIGTTRGFDIDNENILYSGQAYKSSKGTDIFISHLFYVKLKNEKDYPVLECMSEENGVEILGKIEKMDLWYKLACTPLSDCDALSMAAKFYESGVVRYAEPDIMFEARSCGRQPNSYVEYQAPAYTETTSVPNDPLFPNQWYLHNPGGLDINYLEAREITRGDSCIKILLSDIYPVDRTHVDLPELYEAEDWYALGVDDHGTCCAGIIGAKTDNGIGIAGIAPGCKLGFVTVPYTYNVGNAEAIASVFRMVQGRYDVMSCSWYIPYEIFSESQCMLIEESIFMRFQDGRWHWTCDVDLGTVYVFASGNDNSNDICYPAITFSETIAVGAMKKNGKRHPKSNYGMQLDLMAPGEQIFTTTVMQGNSGEEYQYTQFFDRTSAACPQVAAAAALILSINPYLRYDEVEYYLTSTAQPLSENEYYVGAGLLDIGAALKAVLGDMGN